MLRWHTFLTANIILLSVCKTVVKRWSCDLRARVFQENTCQLNSTNTCTVTIKQAALCDEGYYCEKGMKYPCPEGTYNDKSGQSQRSDCLECPAGSYCTGSGRSDKGEKCDAGFLCTGGAKQPNPEPGQGGKPCERGYYCLEGATEMKACGPG